MKNKRGLLGDVPARRPRYDENREVGRNKKKRTDATGAELDREGEEYSDKLQDDFLEAVLVDGLVIFSTGKPSFHVELGKSERSVITNYWKSGVAYPPRSSYIPRNRTDRTGRAWNNPRELHLIKYALSDTGVKHGAADVGYISRILSRDIDDIEQWYSEIFDTTRNFGVGALRTTAPTPENKLMLVRFYLSRKRFTEFPDPKVELSRRRDIL